MDNNSWVKGIFSDLIECHNKGSDKKEITSKKNMVHKNTAHKSGDIVMTSVSKECYNVSQCWNQLFTPQTHQDPLFVVNKKKFNECLDLITKNINKPSLIMFTGPNGCGKTTTLNMICREKNMISHEWIATSKNSVSTDLHNLTFSNVDIFAQFEQTLSEELIFTSDLNSLTKNHNAGRFIVIKEVPNVFLKESNKLVKLLKSLSNRLNFPIIIIHQNCALYSTFCKTLINNLKDEYSVNIINFNPITIKNLQKFGVAMMTHLKIKCSNWIPKHVVEEIATCSGGDIRNFILEMQFKFLSQKLYKNRKKLAQFMDNYEIVRLKSKDQSLTLYHSVGKVLYCKRVVDGDNDKKYLPHKFSHFKRDYPEVDITELLQNLTCSYDVFASTLFENIYHFVHNLDDLRNLYDDICINDQLSSYWNDNLSILTNIQHSAIFLLVQSILFWRGGGHHQQHYTTKHSFHSFIVGNRSIKQRFVNSYDKGLPTSYYIMDSTQNSSTLRMGLWDKQKLALEMDGFTDIQQQQQQLPHEKNTQSQNNLFTDPNEILYYSDLEKIDTDLDDLDY